MLWQILKWAKSGFMHQKMVMLYSSTGSLILFPDLCCLQSPSAPVGCHQEGEKWLGLGDLLGRRTGIKDSDKKEGQEMGKGFIRHASWVSNAVWRSLWFIPAPDHSLNEVNKPNQLCSLHLTCQTCSSGQEDQDWGWSSPARQHLCGTAFWYHPVSVLFQSFCIGIHHFPTERFPQNVKEREHSSLFKWTLHPWLCKDKFASCEPAIKAKSRPPRLESEVKLVTWCPGSAWDGRCNPKPLE